MANTYIHLPSSSIGTVTVSGTVAVTQSTTPWVVGNAYETLTDTITALSDSVDLAFASVRGTVGVLVTGTWVGTIAVQVSVDGITFVASEIIPVASGVIATAIGTNGSWTVPVGGLKAIKLISTAWTSGTATVSLTACTAPHVIEAYCETADNLKTQSFGAVTTAAPSYTTGTTRSLSLNTAGGLRTDGSGVTQPISAASLPLPTGASTAANQATMISSLSAIDAGIPAALGQTTMSASMPVVIASNQSAVSVSGTVTVTGVATETTLSSILGKYTSATATLSNVSASATSVTALASNASRESAIFYNDSTSACYLKFGTTASTTSFTYKLRAAETLIVDGTPVYTGIVDAIWDTATGSMRVTEIT